MDSLLKGVSLTPDTSPGYRSTYPRRALIQKSIIITSAIQSMYLNAIGPNPPIELLFSIFISSVSEFVCLSFICWCCLLRVFYLLLLLLFVCFICVRLMFYILYGSVLKWTLRICLVILLLCLDLYGHAVQRNAGSLLHSHFL